MHSSSSSDYNELLDYQSEEGEFGLIERVAVRNFMCHNNLDLRFAPNVNYVLGKNGSGKSAILAAIMVALGGKVSTTGRGINIKNIIQNGKHVAEIGVTLKNTGLDAIQPDVYGKSITIERKLITDGSSHYKIKNEKGQVLSSKKSDLDSILQAFNIQVHNPVAILTQEISRNFLNSKDARDKYDFFYKATQLEQLEDEHRKAEQGRKTLECTLQSKYEALSELKREIIVLEKKLKDRESIEQQKVKLKELENECSWALVIRDEMKAEAFRVEKLRIESSLEEQKQKLKIKEEKYSSLVEKENSIQEHVTAAQNEIQSLKVERSKIHTETTGLKIQAREFQNNVKKYVKEATLLEKEIEMLTSNIEKTRLRSEEFLRKKEEERLEKINIHVKRKEALIENSNALECTMKELKETLEENKNYHQTKSTTCKALKYKIQNFEKEVEKMKQYQKNRVLAYGHEMPRLIQRINELDRQRAFRCTPIGPVGLQVKIKDSKWTLAIERCLGSRLRSFLCDNMEDADKIQEVIQELGMQQPPSVIYIKFIKMVHDVRKNEVKSSEFCSVLQMLSDTDPIVLNHLIDERSIENILLIESNAQARQVLMRQNTVPPRCYDAFTLSGNNVCPAPNFAFYANRNKHSTLLSSSAYTKNDVKQKIAELERLRFFHQQEQKDLDQLNREIALQSKVLPQKELELSKLKRQIIQEYAELKELENIEESNNIAFLEEELSKVKTTLENVKNEKTKAGDSVHEVFAEILQNEETMKELNEKCEIKAAEINNLMKQSLRSSGLSAVNVQREKVQLENLYNETLKTLEDVKKAYIKAQEEAIKNASQAVLMGDRVNTSRKPEVIENLIDQRKEMLKRNDGFSSFAEVLLMYKKKKSEYECLKQRIKACMQRLKKQEHLIRKRWELFQNIRTHITLRVKYLFIANLISQGYTGKLTFDHKNRGLKIEAQATNCDKTSSRSTKTLSGGERSFITIALMLSLWDAVEIPFRILDEYDVFMDQMNRKHSMDLMLATALKQKRSQFIFLSPLELVPTEHIKKIKIWRMKDPERHSVERQNEESM